MPSSVSAVGFHDLPSIRRLAPGFVVVVWVLPLGCRLAAITRPNRVRFSTGRWFTSGCSPPPLAGTQLPSVTNLRTRSEGDSHSSDSVHFPSHTPASLLAGEAVQWLKNHRSLCDRPLPACWQVKQVGGSDHASPRPAVNCALKTRLAGDLLHLPASWQGSCFSKPGRVSCRPASPASKLAGVVL